MVEEEIVTVEGQTAGDKRVLYVENVSCGCNYYNSVWHFHEKLKIRHPLSKNKRNFVTNSLSYVRLYGSIPLQKKSILLSVSAYLS